jgi:hypothetical protein
MVLLLSRPFMVGDMIWLRAGALGGELEGTVTEIGITYLKLDTASGVLSLPNSLVLAAAVSRLPPGTRPDGPGPDGSGQDGQGQDGQGNDGQGLLPPPP